MSACEGTDLTGVRTRGGWLPFEGVQQIAQAGPSGLRPPGRLGSTVGPT